MVYGFRTFLLPSFPAAAASGCGGGVPAETMRETVRRGDLSLNVRWWPPRAVVETQVVAGCERPRGVVAWAWAWPTGGWGSVCVGGDAAAGAVLEGDGWRLTSSVLPLGGHLIFFSYSDGSVPRVL
jgi:hypothetical protein